jgi:hypothetical protein
LQKAFRRFIFLTTNIANFFKKINTQSEKDADFAASLPVMLVENLVFLSIFGGG